MTPIIHCRKSQREQVSWTLTHTQTDSGVRAVTAQFSSVIAINYQPGCTRNEAQELTPLRLWAALDYFEIKEKCEC